MFSVIPIFIPMRSHASTAPSGPMPMPLAIWMALFLLCFALFTVGATLEMGFNSSVGEKMASWASVLLAGLIVVGLVACAFFFVFVATN